jgi:hypothetical protein
MHHMYIQAKRDSSYQSLPTRYTLIKEDVCLISNDWDEEWKLPPEETKHPDEEEE